MRGNEVTRPGTLVMMTTVSPTPVARTRSSTSFGPIFGTGTVARRSGAPNCGMIIAFIVSGRGMEALRYHDYDGSARGTRPGPPLRVRRGAGRRESIADPRAARDRGTCASLGSRRLVP